MPPLQSLVQPARHHRFLATRWLRLAPLYLLLCVVFIAMLALRNGALADQLFTRLLLNATFGFGFRDPAIWALLIGGWSLGIEFLYYLAFPLVALLLPRRPLAWGVWLALAALQWAWILGTVGSASHTPQASGRRGSNSATYGNARE